MEKLRVGVIGLGSIFSRVMTDFHNARNCELYAVAARDIGRARAAAAKYSAKRAFGSYEELAECPEVDMVYVATPHSFHRSHALMCLAHGKHVLCEKAFAMNGQEAREMIGFAREKGLFIMEAMWTRFMPAMEKLRQLYAEGELGEIRHITADFGYAAQYDPKSRIFAPELGGGALMISLMSGGWGWSQLGWCLTVCGLVGLWLTHAHLTRCWGWELSVRLRLGEARCRLTALVDTGNHLREPLSGSCVLIASARALKGMLPEGFDARSTRLPGREWRMVYYTSLGNQGCMKCFRPDSITVRAGRLSATRSDVWVAVYPGELPGGAQALAPLELSCAPGGVSERGACGDAGYSSRA